MCRWSWEKKPLSQETFSDGLLKIASNLMLVFLVVYMGGKGFLKASFIYLSLPPVKVFKVPGHRATQLWVTA